MTENKRSISRRTFLKTTGAVGIGSLLSSIPSPADTLAKSGTDESQPQLVPTRPFGKYFVKFPEDRQKVFLLTKSFSMRSNKWSEDLEKSFKRMNTSTIDLFLIHGVELFEELRPYRNSVRWAEKAKAEGKIRFFGFSTHTNMERNLLKASKLGWIDGIMFSYNFRSMHAKKMRKAVDACSKAGIGLIAMKTQASGHYYADKVAPNKKEQAIFDHFAEKGLTFEQAKLKAVWGDERIASITSAITNMPILQANVAAAINNTKLSLHDKKRLDQYAHQTASNYCLGCASICESGLSKDVPISDVMRFLMYARCYGELEYAKSNFNQIPLNVRKRMAHIDYKEAEKKCPQRMAIGRCMRDTTTELA